MQIEHGGGVRIGEPTSIDCAASAQRLVSPVWRENRLAIGSGSVGVGALFTRSLLIAGRAPYSLGTNSMMTTTLARATHSVPVHS